MKILIVEDKRETIEGILDFCNDNNYVYKIIDDFNNVFTELNSEDYDLIVLDLKRDPGEDYPGNTIFEQIWGKRFLPIIVNSTFYTTIYDHPFVKYSDKDEEKVKEYLVELSSKIENLKNIREYSNRLFVEGLRAFKRDGETPTILTQRVIMYMEHWLENQINKDVLLPADIQIISLPDYSELITCDIIESIPIYGQSKQMYMIFSPWCDIHNNEEIDLECKPLKKIPNSAVRDKLKSGKNSGGKDGLILLPDNEKFKDMYVDCKSTELIPKKSISLSPNEHDVSLFKYRKLLSIASPYKERMIKICYDDRSRIGVPNLDKESWWR